MGFLDKIMGMFGAAKEAADQVQSHAAASSPPPRMSSRPSVPPPDSPGKDTAMDIARFDWEHDENGFFEAVVAIESEGMTQTSLTRDGAFAKYGIRDHLHWQDAKDNVYRLLAGKYGSFEDVMQREMNFRQTLMQNQMQGNVAAMQAKGGFEPVEGISLEKWAAINAAITQGIHFEDLLKANGLSQARWDKARTEWEARMSKDTTFAIAGVYGQAFQNASNGKWAANVKEANAARAENRDMSTAPPMTVEQYWEMLFEQSFAHQSGQDSKTVFSNLGITITDWVDLGTVMGYHIQRTWAANIERYQAAMKSAEAKVAAKYPGIKSDVELS